MTLDPRDAQHSALAVRTDHLYATRSTLPNPHQLALAIDIEHRSAGKQADHLHLAGRQRRPGQHAGQHGDQ